MARHIALRMSDIMRSKHSRRFPGPTVPLVLLMSLTFAITVRARYPLAPEVTKDGTTVLLEDYASVPLSSRTTSGYPPNIDFTGQLSRVNFLRSEPDDAPESSTRFFVNDLNRNLYIVERATRQFIPYINFEEVFPKFDNNPGYAGGLDRKTSLLRIEAGRVGPRHSAHQVGIH